MTPEIRAALVIHKPALLAMLASLSEAAPEPEVLGCIRPDPIMDSPGWRKSLRRWPIPWRQRWADRVEVLQVTGKFWQEAESQAFLETVDQINAAEANGEVIEFTEPAPSDDAATREAILAWRPYEDWSWTELTESGHRHNEAVLSRPAAAQQATEPPVSIPDSLQQPIFFE
jgi:hypothetical protein